MTVLTATRQALTPKELRGWPHTVQTALLTIVNNRGVKHRWIDSNHFLLYPPDGESRPVKFSKSRGETSLMRYLDLFVDNHLGRYVPEPRDDRPANEKELSALTSLNTTARKARDKAEEEWTPHIGSNGQPTSFETNGRVFRCTVAGCTSPILAKATALGAHAVQHAKRTEQPKIETPLLSQIRKARGLTQQQVADHFDITSTGYSFWEKKGWVKPDDAPKLAKVLGVPENVLMGSVMPALERFPDAGRALPATQPEPVAAKAPRALHAVETIPLPEPAEAEASQEAQRADLGASQPEPEQSGHDSTADARSAVLRSLVEISDIAARELGRENIAGDLLAARQRITDLERELAERDATLDLMREALGLAR